MDTFENVVATALTEADRGVDMRAALQGAARVHREPEHQRRLDLRRAQLGALALDALEARAARFGIAPRPRAELVERLARHEVNNELQVALATAALGGDR